MARKLENKPNVTAPGGAYSFGRIKDDTGAEDGTPVNEEVYGDMHQFFEKIMAEAGLTHNNSPENDTTGYQYLDALKKIIDNGHDAVQHVVGAVGEIPFSTGNLADPDPGTALRYSKIGKYVTIEGSFFASEVVGGPLNVPVCQLPTGFRPELKSMNFPVFKGGAITPLLVDTDGRILRANPSGMPDTTYYIGSIRFKVA